MQFVSQIKTARTTTQEKAANVFTLEIHEIHEKLVDAKTPSNLCEYIDGNPFGKIYFDYDAYRKTMPSDEELTQILDKFKQDIFNVMEDQDSFRQESLLCGSRHGKSPKKEDEIKLSFRAWIFEDWKARPSQIKELIELKKLDTKCGGPFDTTVYKDHDQLMACVFTAKGGRDRRVLTPIGEPAPIQDYIIQYLVGDEKEVNMEIPRLKRKEADESERLQQNVNPEHGLAPPENSGFPSPSSGRSVDDATVFRLLELLKPIRWSERDYWLKIAFALNHEAGDHFDESFMKYSRTSPEHFDEAENRKTLIDIHSRNLSTISKPVTIGTLFSYAKEDSPCTFNSEFLHQGQKKKLEECITSNGAPHRMAELFAIMYGDIIKCTNAKKQSFYAFSNHRWSPSGASQVSVMLSRSFYMTFIRYARSLADVVVKAENEDDRNRLEQRRSAANKIAGGLLNPKVKCSIITEIANILLDSKFRESLDSRPELLGFDNGVYDLMKGKFRDSQPDDLVSVSCGYDFNPQMDQAVRNEVRALISSCFESPEMTQYFFDVTSACLYGHRRFEIFVIFTGTAANGKSSLSDLFKATLGEYFGTISSAFFTRPFRDSNEATPELADKKAVRFLLSSEPEASEKLQVSKLKLITGGDTVTARNLYDSPFSFVPQFGIFIQTNDIPQLNKLDGGIMRRLRVIPFPFTFTSDPKFPHEKLADPFLKENKLRRLDWKQQSMLLLIENFTNRIREADILQTPDEVIKASKEYIDSNNAVKRWLEKYCIFTGDRKDRIGSQNLYDYYRTTAEEELLDMRKWSQQMSYSGIIKDQDRRGIWWIGIQMKE